MNRFYRTFFSENPHQASELTLFAFGKHPGWNDHVEGLGLHNDTLAFCHSVFYVNGIRAVIDSGVWEKTDPVKVIPEFGNTVIWQGRKAFIICRLWPSKDGKGRDKYPMIVGMYGGGISILQAGPMIFPVLERLEQSCRKAKTADEVRAIITEAGEALRQDIGTLSGSQVVPPLDEAEYKTLLDHEGMPNREEGWARILYTFKNQLSSFSHGSFHAKTAEDQGGQSMRLPLLHQSSKQGLIDWLRFMRPEIDPMVPIFLTSPHDRSWVDVIIGEPDPSDLSCLKLNLEGIPTLDQVPYNIPDSFREYAQNCLESWKQIGTEEGGTFFTGLQNNEPGNKGGKGPGQWIRSLFGKS